MFCGCFTRYDSVETSASSFTKPFTSKAHIDPAGILSIDDADPES